MFMFIPSSLLGFCVSEGLMKAQAVVLGSVCSGRCLQGHQYVSDELDEFKEMS